MEHLSHKKKLTIMIALMVSMFFAAINQTLVSTAMPRIIAMLGGLEYYSWVITIYLLTSTVATVLVGKLSDLYGRKPFLLLGIGVFMIGAFLTGLSTNIFEMIAYRGLQGLGGGVLMAVTMMAVGDLFAPRERAKWTGLMMSVFGFSSIIGPTLGGVMIDLMHWHWLFWAFLPLGFLALLMIWRLFPAKTERTKVSIDYAGSLFLAAAIITLLLGFSWAGSRFAWNSLEIISLFGLTAIFTLVLLGIERKAINPVLPLSLFKNSIVTLSNAIGFLMHAAMMGAMIYIPFFVQGVQGLSPTQSGLVNMPMSLMMIVLSGLVGRWMSKTGKYKTYAIVGICLMLSGMLLMAFMDSIWLAIASMSLFGMGLGMSMPVFSLTVQNAMPASELGVATATSTLFRNLGGTIGIAVMGAVMNTTLTRNLARSIEEEALDVAPLLPQGETPASLFDPQLLLDQPRMEVFRASLSETGQGLFDQLVAMLRGALDNTLSTVFLLGASLLLAALVLVLFLKEIPLRSAQQKADPSNESAA